MGLFVSLGFPSMGDEGAVSATARGCGPSRQCRQGKCYKHAGRRCWMRRPDAWSLCNVIISQIALSNLVEKLYILVSSILLYDPKTSQQKPQRDFCSWTSSYRHVSCPRHCIPSHCLCIFWLQGSKLKIWVSRDMGGPAWVLWLRTPVFPLPSFHGF